MTADDIQQTRELVRRAIVTVLPSLEGATINQDVHLRELGADSVDRVEIILLILQRLGLDQPMSTFSQVPDIGRLVTLLHELKEVRP